MDRFDCNRCTLPFVFGVLLSAGILVPSSGETPGLGPRYKTSPFQQVAEDLQTRKVVGLADFDHENAYPYYTLIEVLSAWLDRAEKAGGGMTLALEADPKTVDVLQGYLRTGDWQPVLDYLLPYSSLERLEFYQKLREFHLRLGKVNQDRPVDRRIPFSILGLEPVSLFSDINAVDPCTLGTMGQVANQRDRQIAQRLLAHLAAHPSERVLLFYGMDHLRKEVTNQSWAQRLFVAKEPWRPFGSLLNQELGTGFLSIAQTSYPPVLRQLGNPYCDLITQDLYFRSPDIPWKVTRIDPGNFDAVIFLRPERIDVVHSMRFLCSRRILKEAVDKLARLEQHPPNPFTRQYLDRTLEGLRCITDQSFVRADQWRRWSAEHPYDGFTRLESEAFAQWVRQECGQLNQSRSAMLASLGLPPAYYGMRHQETSEEWLNKTWKALFPRVKLLQCIGLYWIGDSQESERARDYLDQSTGQRLESAAAYLKWYRQTSLNLPF